MSNVVISLMLAAGVSAWMYNKFQQKSGYNTEQSVKATAFVGGAVFLVALLFLSGLN